MKRILIVLLVVVTIPAVSQTMTAVEYQMGFGAGKFTDYISQASFRGFAFNFRKLVQPQLAVGVEMGWNVFYEEKAYDVYTIGNTSYAGKQYRYANEFPMLLRADFNLKPGERINPYVGWGVGTLFSIKTNDMGQYRFEDEGWHFAIKPEFGLEIEANENMALTISAKYYYGFETSDIRPLGYFALGFGMLFKD
jgi:opacity protein-like surface antigen